VIKKFHLNRVLVFLNSLKGEPEVAGEILVADSNKADQEEFQKIFETTDYHLVFSESGQDVLLRVKLFKPDLIIAGKALSEKNGFELCEALKGDPEFRNIPFILLLNNLGEISEKDKKRLKPDGILSKPLHESEVLNVVDRLVEGMRVKGERISGKEAGWDSFSGGKKDVFLSNEFVEKAEDEIIDLVDVVEEAESKMSIDDFAIPQKEEPFGEIVPLESWDKLEGEEKLAAEEGLVLSFKEDEGKKEIPPRLQKEAPPEETPQKEELFEKIELEDVLERVGGREPSPEMELERREVSVSEPEEKLLGLDEFEALLKRGVETEVPRSESLEETLQPVSFVEPKAEVQEEISPIEIPEEQLEELEDLAKETFPKGLLEEALKEERAGTTERLEEEELEELKEEDFGELREEELGELKGEELEKMEEEELEEIKEEELEGIETEELEVLEEFQRMEEVKEGHIELFEELEAPKAQEETMTRVEETPPIEKERPAEALAETFFQEAVGVPFKRVGQQMEEILTEKVQTMMEEFITKHVPEMTKDLVGLTIERIEKLVKEIVPDLAEKMIEEEIQRLEKEEKD
jgi:CheY-like chemotaxis protein